MRVGTFLLIMAFIIPAITWVCCYIHYYRISSDDIVADSIIPPFMIFIVSSVTGFLLFIASLDSSSPIVTKYVNVESVLYYGRDMYREQEFRVTCKDEDLYKLTVDDDGFYAKRIDNVNGTRLPIIYLDNVKTPYIGYVEYYDPLHIVKTFKIALIMDSSYKNYGIEKVYASNNYATIESLVYSKN